MLKIRLAAALVSATAFIVPSTFASAQSDRAAEIAGFHMMCNHGDRRACVRFGMLIEHNRDMGAEWRRIHPEWFWFER